MVTLNTYIVFYSIPWIHQAYPANIETGVHLGTMLTPGEHPCHIATDILKMCFPILP